MGNVPAHDRESPRLLLSYGDYVIDLSRWSEDTVRWVADPGINRQLVMQDVHTAEQLLLELKDFIQLTVDQEKTT